MTRLLLFLSSLSPGIVVASIRYIGESACWGTVGVVAGALLMPLGLLTIRSRKKTNTIPTELSSIRDETYQVPTYLITFVLPFLFVGIQDVQTLVSYVIFILFVSAILTKSDISIVNPSLLIANYRMYDVVDKEERSLTIISRTTPRITQFENLRHLSGRLYLLEPQESENR